MNTDRIEKTILLHASRKRVWSALSDSKEFGSWFGMKFDGPFVPGKKITGEPTTLVVFVLAEAAGGVMLTVTESGFDQIPLARRATAFNANQHGWAAVVQLIEAYLAGAH